MQQPFFSFAIILFPFTNDVPHVFLLFKNVSTIEGKSSCVPKWTIDKEKAFKPIEP